MSTFKDVLDHRFEQDMWALPLQGRPYVLASENDAAELLADMLGKDLIADRIGAGRAVIERRALKFLEGARVLGMDIKAAT